jgi:ectoine hydroxylase-related dioxygenase (phytanoyl-CoA dioxygenase family)
MDRSARDEFRDRGVVFVPGALDAAALARCEAAFEWSLAHPGPGASPLVADSEGRSYQDLNNREARTQPVYLDALHHTPVAGLVADLWGERDVWFMYEQVFLKDGGEVGPTLWHQDSSYLPIEGEHLAVVWISFDRLSREESLEFVVGSHRGPLYGRTIGRSAVPGPDDLPPHPDIEAERAGLDIVAWPIEPGDVVVFHPRLIHGGAPIHAGNRRRTLSLRFFGPDAVVARRPGGNVGAFAPALHDAPEGAPFRDPVFPKVPLAV